MLLAHDYDCYCLYYDAYDYDHDYLLLRLFSLLLRHRVDRGDGWELAPEGVEAGADVEDGLRPGVPQHLRHSGQRLAVPHGQTLRGHGAAVVDGRGVQVGLLHDRHGLVAGAAHEPCGAGAVARLDDLFAYIIVVIVWLFVARYCCVCLCAYMLSPALMCR